VVFDFGAKRRVNANFTRKSDYLPTGAERSLYECKQGFPRAMRELHRPGASSSWATVLRHGIRYHEGIIAKITKKTSYLRDFIAQIMGIVPQARVWRMAQGSG
jgi:hypothetical protein